MRRSDLPFGSEFSPTKMSLPRLLELAEANDGDWKAFEAAVRAEYFEQTSADEYNKAKRANNTKLSMIAYGIIDRDGNLTALGKMLNALRSDENQLYRELARHILLNLRGMTFVQCIQDMHAAGEVVDLVKLRSWLEERGVHFPRGSSQPSTMRLWLEKAGVFIDGWRVDDARMQELLSTSLSDVDMLAQFSPEQRAYLKTLANIGTPGPHLSNDVAKLAHTTYGTRFNEKSLPQQVLYPLERAGYIILTRATKGRGAKPATIAPTAKLEANIITPLLDQLERQTGAELRPLLRKPFADILTDLRDSDKYVRGLALEALAFKLMRLLDLTYVATRLRGPATGGAEVDVIFEGSRLVFSRWQIQCKNVAGGVSLDDVAKEVGLTHMLKSNVIVMVSTSTIGPEARRYANKIMQDSHLCIVMLDGADMRAIERNPTAIVDTLNREARHAMTLKALDM